MAVIAEQGVAGATQRSVADAAGASLASTTYHFGTRSGLLAATLDHAATTAIAELDGLRDEIIAGQTELVEACLRYVARQRSGQSRTAIVVFELAIAATREPALRESNDRFITALREIFTPFTTAAGADSAVAEAFYGMLLLELARGDTPSPGLETTISAIFDAFGVTAAARAMREASR